MTDTAILKKRRMAPLATPSGHSAEATRDTCEELDALLAIHTHCTSKPRRLPLAHVRPVLSQLPLCSMSRRSRFSLSSTRLPNAFEARGTTLRSAGRVAGCDGCSDNDADFVTPGGMLAELREDNRRLAAFMRETRGPVRRVRGCGDGQPARGLDRRGGAPDVVPVRTGRAG